MTAKPPGQQSHLEKKQTETQLTDWESPKLPAPGQNPLQKEDVYGCEKAHLEPGVAKNILKTGTDFFFISYFHCEKQSWQQTANLPATQGLFLCFHIFCLCLCVSDVIKELLETASHQPHF